MRGFNIMKTISGCNLIRSVLVLILISPITIYCADEAPIPAESVIVTDDVASYIDLSWDSDIDLAGDRELTVRWNFSDFNVKDVHVYVIVDNQGRAKYLGRVGNGSTNYYQWKAGNRFVAGKFASGPEAGHSYRFGIYLIKESGPKTIVGPFFTAGPVDYQVGELPSTPTPTPIIVPVEQDCVVVSDFLDAAVTGVSTVSLNGIIISEALDSDGASALLNVADCSGDGQLNVQIPWSGADAEQLASIQFGQEICPDDGPNEASIFLASPNDVLLTAFNDIGDIVAKATLTITIENNVTTEIKPVVLTSDSGIRLIQIEGTGICLSKICWTCEGIIIEPTPEEPTPTPVMIPTPTVTPIPPSVEMACVIPSDYVISAGTAESVDLLYAEIFAALSSEGDYVPLEITDCSNNELMDIKIPWSGAGAQRLSAIYFDEDVCSVSGPFIADLYLNSPDQVKLVAYDIDGNTVDTAVFTEESIDDIENNLNSGNAILTINIQNNSTAVQPVSLSSNSGIRMIEIEGTDICLQKICWSCEQLVPQPTPTPGIPPIVDGSVVITDDIDSFEDLTNGVDVDLPDQRELVVRWKIDNYSAKDYHVYVLVDGSTKRNYLGRTGSDDNFYRWNNQTRFVTGRFKDGPQSGHHYQFMVFALSTDEAVKPFGPISSSGSVEYIVGDEEPPFEPTPQIPDNSVIVTDDSSSYIDLSNNEDRDLEDKKELAIRWRFDDVVAKDFHLYVLEDNQGKPKYLGRTKGGNVNLFSWREDNSLVAGSFKKGPQPGHEYRFYLYIMHETGPMAISGPFSTQGPVLYLLGEDEFPEPEYTPTPTFGDIDSATDEVTPTPTITATPEIQDGTPAVDVPSVIVTDSINTFDDLSNGQDIDMPGNKELVIRWSPALLVDAKEVEVKMLIDGEGELLLLGSTKNPEELALRWFLGSKDIVGRFKGGPIPNHSYRFYVYIHLKKGPKTIVGPFSNIGPVDFKVSQIVSPTLTPTPDDDLEDQATPVIDEPTPEPTATPKNGKPDDNPGQDKKNTPTPTLKPEPDNPDDPSPTPELEPTATPKNGKPDDNPGQDKKKTPTPLPQSDDLEPTPTPKNGKPDKPGKN
jgi:hypothetical protein